MSRIGKKPVALPDGVSVDVSTGGITVKGPKGELSRDFVPQVTVSVDGSTVVVTKDDQSQKADAFQGLCRTLISNMVTGVNQGYERKLELVGVGYRAEVQGRTLTLNVGYSNPVEFPLPDGVDAEADRTKITLKSIDKELLGQTAAVIRGYRPPEPYKGKGIKYAEEIIRRKAGKAGVR